MKLKLSIVLIILILSSAFIKLKVYCQSASNFSSCKPPYSVRVKNKGLDYATITWKNSTNNTAWILKWREDGLEYDTNNISNSVDTNQYTINNLNPNTKYFFRLKSICDSEESNWSNEYSFITNLTNPSDCGMHFKLKDRTSSYLGKTYFKIQNIEYPDKLLGQDVFIQKIKLVVSHSWTSDLQINLMSPSGKKIVLTNSNGLNDGIGYGDPIDSTCQSTVVFSDDACHSIKDNDFPFIGLYKPEEAISNLYDSISPFGIWELEIIDKLKGNTGFLEYIDIDFEPIICPLPKEISFVPLNDSETSVSWIPNPNIDTVFINIDNENELTFTNSGNEIISGLLNYPEHEFTVKSKCNQNISSVSCPISINMLCTIPTQREDFDKYEIYNSSCGEDCFDSDIWYNLTSKKWLINSGPTSTNNTGPENDIYGYGKYAFVESSESDDNSDTIAILQSECLEIETPYLGCSMSFYYHMFGIDIGSLQLDISTDGGKTWENLFYIKGDQGNQWVKKDITLNNYAETSSIFRFIAKTLKNKNYGDIAIDDIVFYNAQFPLEESHLYYPDNDGDGYGKDTSGVFYCVAPGENYVKNNLDCNDDNYFINPDAEEIHCNSIDENCNGMDDDPNTVNPMVYYIDSIKTESCYGSNDGGIFISISGGAPPYQYLWSNNSTDSILTGVSAGKYLCIIQDQSGCELFTDTIIIENKNSIQIEIANTVAPSCSSAKDGSIFIAVSGGIAPYTYQWSTQDTTKDLQNVGPGLYSVTVSDSIGCRNIIKEFELKANTLFDIGILNKKDPSCFGGDNGKISLIVTGGHPPYTYHWSNGDTTSIANNLKKGEYYCTITDSELCYQVYGPLILSEPNPLEVNILSKDNVTCDGEENGLIEINTIGGTPPYSFIWTNDNGSYLNFNDDIYNLKAGLYYLSIVDTKGCHKSIDSIAIETIDSFKLQIDTINHVKCSRAKDGYIRVNGIDGYGQYYYYWNNGKTQSNEIDSLFAGTYSITATDDLGCKSILDNIEIKNLNIPINVNIIQLDSIFCFNDKTAKIKASVDSPNPPFDYNWSAGTKKIRFEATDTLSGLGAGNYDVTITDEKGCIGISDSLSIEQPEQLQIKDVNVNEILCFDDNSGMISLKIEGGIPEYKILWNDSLYTGKEIIKLKAGTYYCTITDQNNCSIESNEIIIKQPDEIKVDIISNPAHKNYADGSAKLLIQGGVSPYEIQWDENTGNQTGFEAVNLASGGYDVTITDFNECIKEIKVFITEISATDNPLSNKILVYPNPTNKNLLISGISTENIVFELISISGKKYKPNSSLIKPEIYKIDVTQIPSGSYFLKIINHKGLPVYKHIAIVH